MPFKKTIYLFKTSRSKKRFYFFFNLLIIISLLVIFELSLRFFSYIPNSIYRPDKNLHYDLVPSSVKKTYYSKDGNKPAYVSINKHGFRGNNQKSISGDNILVFGDSFIFAEFSKEKNTFCAQLEKIINGEKKANVLNMGVVGYGPEQSLKKLITQSQKYKPKLIIFSIYAGNDYGDMIRNKILYIDRNNGTTIFNTNKLDFNIVSSLKNGAFPEFPHNLQIVKRFKKRFPKMFTDLYNELPPNLMDSNYVKWCISRCQQDYQIYENESQSYCTNIFGDYFDADIALGLNANSSVSKMNLMDKLINELSIYREKEFCEVIVMIIPSKINLISKFQKFYNLQNYSNYIPENLSFSIEKICLQNNLLVLNLYEHFLKNNPNNLYLSEGDDHWNDDGQLLAASLVNNFIINKNIL